MFCSLIPYLFHSCGRILRYFWLLHKH